MRRAEYLANPDVIAFAAWMKKRLCEPGSFTHSWTSGYGRAWSCSSLYGAYLGYRWPDNSTQSLDEVSRELDEFSSRIRRAVEQGDQVAFNDAALAALDWGRVAGSREKLDAFWRAAPDALLRLNPASADLDDLTGIMMNSSWTKLYHLLLDGFPIYDGRVGAAIAYFVRIFLEETGRSDIPSLLHLRWGKSRPRKYGPGPRRDPSSASMNFVSLSTNQQAHSRCNVMAAWLLGELSTFECFGQLPGQRRQRALEAALFMVGYELPAAGTPFEATVSLSEGGEGPFHRPTQRASEKRTKNPRRSRYEPLREWLDAHEGTRITVQFTQLDGLVGGLPPTARRSDSYWSGTAAGAPTHTWKRAWEEAGFTVDSFSRSDEWVTFRRA